MICFTINVYTHNFSVTGFSREIKELLVKFSERFTEYEFIRSWDGNVDRKDTRRFIAATKDRKEFRFHINCLEDFYVFMQRFGYRKEYIEVVSHDRYEPYRCVFKLKSTHKPYEEQLPHIDYISSQQLSTVTELQTGKGKTSCALVGMVNLGVRTLIVLKPMFVDRWLGDLVGKNSILESKKDDIMLVKSFKDLADIIELALLDALDAKIIVMSNTIMRMYFDNYELLNRNCELFHGVSPVDFYRVLKIGFRIVDEVHMDFHLNFRMDLYTHGCKTCCLSATLDSDQQFINSMYELMFPKLTRLNAGEYHKYIGCTALFYNLNDRGAIRYKQRGRQSYSHTAFEACILKRASLTRNYLRMIDAVVSNKYIKVATQGQRMIIFAATVEMCTTIADDLKQRYPSKIISKYTQEDQYEVLNKSDIIVSTLIKAGTAVDIKGLRVVLVTTAIGSRQTNLQALGRLRELKDYKDVTPEFLYFVCLDIRSHVDYHQRKLESFKGKVIYHKIFNMGLNL